MAGPLAESVRLLGDAAIHAEAAKSVIREAQNDLNKIVEKVQYVYDGLDIPSDIWQAADHLRGVLNLALQGFDGLADKIEGTAVRIHTATIQN